MMARLSYRRLFAWAVLCCSLSALCGFSQSIGLALIVVAIFSCPLLAYWWQVESIFTPSLIVVICRLLFLLLPLSFFIYTASNSVSHSESAAKKHARRLSNNAWFNQTSESSIVKFCGKRLVVKASVERILKQSGEHTQMIIANCSGVDFPEEEIACGRACFVSELIEPSKISAGDSISVACYLRSAKFSSFKKNQIAKEACAYLEPHKKNFDVFAFVHPQDVRVLSRPLNAAKADIGPFIVYCRERIATGHILALGAEQGALLTSIVLGQNAVDLPKKTIDNFRNSGLSHIVAASGFNLTIVILVTNLLLRTIRLPANAGEYACLLMVVVYVALAGLSASIVRAGMMASFILLSKIGQHQVRIASVIAAALFVTCLPSLQALLDVGLQLSYIATVGVVVGVRAFADAINSRSNCVWQKCAEIFAATVVAQLSVLPIQLFYFGTLGLTFLPANLIVVPAIEIVTIGGFISSIFILIGSFCPVGEFLTNAIAGALDWGLSFPLRCFIWITETFSAMQWAQLKIQQPSLNAIAVYYAIITYSFYLLKFPSKKFIAFTLMIVAVALICLSII